MPNPNITCNDPSRTLVQFELPELKNIFYQALRTHDIDKLNELVYELSHRRTSRAKKLSADVTSELDNL